MKKSHKKDWGQIDLTFEITIALIAFTCTGLYILFPVPILMGIFVFICQPLFAILVLSIIYKIFKELKSRKVL